MEVDQSQENGIATFVIRGEFDVFNVQAFKDATGAVNLDGGANIVIDLTETPYADSTALGSILALHKRVNEAQGKIALVAPTGGSVRDLLRITKVDRLFAVCENQAEALKALQG